MQTSVERLEGSRVKLTVTVPNETVDRAIEQAYGELAGQVRIPGFRKGKAPRPLIDTHVGRDAVLAEAQEAVINDSYGRALSVEWLHPLDSPDMGELDTLVEGTEYTYTAELELRPELTLTSYDDFSVTVAPATASDREVQAQIDYTRERFATLETVERGVEQGDFALISFVGTIDGEPYDGDTVDHYLYETGRGLMPEEFDAVLLGTTVGESAVATFTIPESSSDPQYIGKEARFEIQVHEVKTKILPELDDEFAASVGGFDSYEEYATDVRSKLDEAKASGRARRIEVAAVDVLAERLEGDVPEQLVHARASSMAREFAEKLHERGMRFEDYLAATGLPPEQVEGDIRAQALARVREELALEALFREKGLVVLDEDIEETVLAMAGGDAPEAERLREGLTESGALPLARLQLTHQRALDWLLANMAIVEEDPFADEAEEPAAAEAGTKKRTRRSKKRDAAAEDKE